MAMVVPQIFADAVNEKLGTSLRIGRVAFDATNLVGDIKQAGDTIHFPSVVRNASVVEVNDKNPLTFGDATMTDLTASIKQIACPMRVFDKDNTQVKSGLLDKIVIQVAEAMQQKIDGDLVKEMDASAVYKTATASATSITNAELQAGMMNFGDEIDGDSFAGIIINSRLAPSFYAMPEFVESNKTYSVDGNGKVTNGVIGYLNGSIPVILCNNGTFDDTAKECKTYIVKREALGLVFQRDIEIKEQYKIEYLATYIAATALYAVKLLDKKGCVILRKTVPVV